MRVRKQCKCCGRWYEEERLSEGTVNEYSGIQLCTECFLNIGKPRRKNDNKDAAAREACWVQKMR